MNRACRLGVIPVCVFLACFFSFAARHRFIDGDEGFYLLASRLAMEHKVPYVDFFYLQAPLLPYAYDLWMKLFSISWFSARSFSAALTTIVGLLIYGHVCRETQKWSAGAAGVILFASSSLIFAWFPLAKTYSLSAVFLFGAYAIVARLTRQSSSWLVASAGLLFGLSVDTRSYLAGLAPVFLLWIFRHGESQRGASRVLWFLGGFTAGIAPCLYFLSAAPDLFLFYNLGYHAIRSDGGLIGAWRSKLHTTLTVLFGAENNGGQFSVLAAASLFAILALRRRGSATLPAFSIALALGFISILPTPPFVQYFCLCMPFLIVAAICGTAEHFTSLRAAHPRWAGLVAGVAIAAFVASSAPSFGRYLFTGENVIGLNGSRDAPNWTLDKVTEVSKAIDQLAYPKEEIASFWPGYIFASKADPSPGFVNDFGWGIIRKLTADETAKYHIVTLTAIENAFGAHTPRIAVLGNQGNVPHVFEWERILRTNGYVRARTIGDTSIFVFSSGQ